MLYGRSGDMCTIGDGGVELGDACEVCYACIQNCPQGAIYLPGERSEARFRNKHVSLAGIIAANGQARKRESAKASGLESTSSQNIRTMMAS